MRGKELLQMVQSGAEQSQIVELPVENSRFDQASIAGFQPFVIRKIANVSPFERGSSTVSCATYPRFW